MKIILQLPLIITLLLSFVYYNQLLKCIGQFHQQLKGAAVTATVVHNAEKEGGPTTVKRIKRFLIFQGGGVVKLVLGTSFPITMPDKKRSLNYFYNFQMQYAPPAIPLYWWSVFNTTTFAARTNLRKRSVAPSTACDKTRKAIYEFIEAVLERSGDSGIDCLLRIICELARAPFIEHSHSLPPRNPHSHIENNMADDLGRNIYHELLNAIFTPARSNANERYWNARLAGKNGASCVATYGECGIVQQLFNSFTHFI